MKILLLLATLSIAASLARADIAPNPMSGGISLQTTGYEQTDIALRHNTVKIKVTPELCTTRAFFRLKNGSKPTTLEVGFPLFHEGESSNFQLFIGDKPAAFADKTEKYVGRYGFERERYCKAWKMKFAADQTRLVEVRYSNPPSAGVSTNLRAFTGYNFNLYDVNTPIDYQMADYGFPRSVMSSELGKLRMMEYILVTGSYWKGPIERCTVEADIEEVATDAIADVFPAAQLLNSRRIVWSWKNVEPPRNIRMIFLSDSPRKVIPYFEKIAEQNPTDRALKDNLADMKADFLDESKVRRRQKEFVDGNGANTSRSGQNPAW